MADYAGSKKIKEVRALLSRTSMRRKTGLFVIEGERICSEAPAEETEAVYVSETYLKEHPETHADYIIRDRDMGAIFDTQHPQGILSVVRQRQLRAEDLTGRDTYLLLETIQDPGNLGTIIRTAEAAGVDAVIMDRGCADIYSPKVARSTMGAIFRLPFAYTESIAEYAKILTDDGVTVYAAHLNGQDITGRSPAPRKAYMIGNEGNGLTDEAASAAREIIRIPMEGKTESLNAAVSAAILCYWGRI